MKTLEYSAHNEDVSDYFLLSEAEKRMADNNDSENISHEQMLKELGITEKDLDGRTFIQIIDDADELFKNLKRTDIPYFIFVD